MAALMEPENLFRLVEEYGNEVKPMRTQSAATGFLATDGRQKIYSDGIATIHAGATMRSLIRVAPGCKRSHCFCA
jgi:hypothetical protein